MSNVCLIAEPMVEVWIIAVSKTVVTLVPLYFSQPYLRQSPQNFAHNFERPTLVKQPTLVNPLLPIQPSVSMLGVRGGLNEGLRPRRETGEVMLQSCVVVALSTCSPV
jgi:hypothetical protein